MDSSSVVGLLRCCGKCVKAVAKALETVPGVKGNTADKKVKSFKVTGSFEPQAVLDALAKAGLTGRVAK